MDLSNLKSSLFGYNKLAVSNYVSGLESASNQKIQDLQKAAKETEDTLRSQIEELRTKYEEEVQKLNDKIDALTEERDLLRRDNDTIADTLLDAEEYAADLRCKADQKAKERDEEHLQVLTTQQNKVQQIDTKLHGVLGAIGDLLAAASETLTSHAKELEETGQEIEDEKAIYEPQEEAVEEAVEEAEEEAAEEAEEEAAEEAEEEAAEEAEEEAAEESEEEAAEEAEEEAAEEAEEETAEEAEEEAAGESVLDQWKQFYGQEKEESVSKFEQAAEEIAGKLQ